MSHSPHRQQILTALRAEQDRLGPRTWLLPDATLRHIDLPPSRRAQILEQLWIDGHIDMRTQPFRVRALPPTAPQLHLGEG